MGLALLALLATEMALRFAIGAPRAEQLPLLRVQPDPRLGYRPLPRDTHFAYDQPVVLNSLGLRGPEIGVKQHAECRILALGETQVFGLGLADEELLTHRLEVDLNAAAKGDRRFRVINFSVRAFGLNQQTTLLESLGTTLSPDHVVVFIFVHSLRALDTRAYYERVKDRGWYMLDIDSKPAGLALWKWRAVQLARKSALLAWLHSGYKAWRDQHGLASKMLHGDHDIEVDERFDYVREQLDRILHLSRTHGFSVTLAVIPLPRQLMHSYPNARYQSALRNIAAERAVPFIDLLPPLTEAYRNTGWLPVAPFDDHYNAVAHAAMGTAISDELKAKIFSGNDSSRAKACRMASRPRGDGRRGDSNVTR